MTHMTYTPGYQGYLRNFQRDYVVGKDVPSRKYRDFEVETHGLMADMRWRSETATRFDGPTFLAHVQAQPGGTTRVTASHKDSRQAARIREATAATTVAGSSPTEEKEAWNWQMGAGSGSPDSLVPRAGRARNTGSPVYGTTYGDSIGSGTRTAGPVAPRFPYGSTQFVRTGDALPPLDATLTKSLPQAIASLPAAENLLKGDVDLHSSYSRDLGHRGHHPLQRNQGLVGGPPQIHPYTTTAGSAAATYARAPPTHFHAFPSAHLIGPSGVKVGPSPIEGMNEYPHTAYAPTAAVPASPAEPFTRVPSASRVRDGICETATTRELFAGSTKSTAFRMPGYAGFVPAAETNQLALTGVVQTQPHTKDNILQTYKHDLPSYTGHQPRCVVNVRGPRTPRGKKRLNEGLVASLILDSMKI